MESRDQLSNELSNGLQRLRDQESSIANRASAILSVATIVLALVLAFSEQKNLQVPMFLVSGYVVVAVVGAICVSGRELVDPVLDVNLRRYWYGVSSEDLDQILLSAKRIALRANIERLVFVRWSFRILLLLVIATLVSSLVYLGSQ